MQEKELLATRTDLLKLSIGSIFLWYLVSAWPWLIHSE